MICTHCLNVFKEVNLKVVVLMDLSCSKKVWMNLRFQSSTMDIWTMKKIRPALLCGSRSETAACNIINLTLIGGILKKYYKQLYGVPLKEPLRTIQFTPSSSRIAPPYPRISLHLGPIRTHCDAYASVEPRTAVAARSQDPRRTTNRE